MKLNQYGRIVNECWKWLFQQYSYLDVDEFVVMPNHFHGIIIVMDDECRGGSRTAPTPKRKPLGRLIGAFKTVSTKHINQLRNTSGHKLWQRNYFERIIRNENELFNMRQYIQENPLKWDLDPENPNAKA